MGERNGETEKGTSAGEPIRPDYERWAKESGWTAAQAASLLSDTEPTANVTSHERETPQQQEHIRLLIEKDSGKSLTWLPLNTAFPLFAPYDVLRWADDHLLRVPDLLRAAVIRSWPSPFRAGQFLSAIDTLKGEIKRLESELAKTRNEMTPPYLRRDHAHYAIELAAAVRTWIAISGSGEFDGKHAAKPLLESWLNEHGKELTETRTGLSNAAVRRIAVVANPRKSGGAPRRKPQ